MESKAGISENLFLYVIICIFLMQIIYSCKKNKNHEFKKESQHLISDNNLVEKPGINQPTTITIELENLSAGSKKLQMVLINPGRYLMGSPQNEPGRSKSDWDQHELIISKPFYMGMYEVTQAQWEAVMGKRRHIPYFKNRPDNPVEKVSWLEARRFISKLNKLGHGSFRLPTEGEWEYACRAGSNTDYPFNYIKNSSDYDLEFTETANLYIWSALNSSDKSTNPVGLKLPNSWGLFDMNGNVWEWCTDEYIKPYNRASYFDAQRPSSWISYFTILKKRVARGGSFYNDLKDCRSSSRMYEQSVDYHYSIGFRLVREYQEKN